MATLASLAVHLGGAEAAVPVTIGEEGEGAGQYRNPKSAAVDQSSGAFYIADAENNRVDKYDAAGDFLLSWGIGVADPDTATLQTCGPAASPPTAKCFPGHPEVGGVEGPTANPNVVAVDQSTGDVYSLGAYRVEKFNSDGEFLLMFGKNVNVTPGSPHPNLCTAADLSAGDICRMAESADEPGALFNPAAITVDAGGKLWVSDFERIQAFNSDGTFDSEVALPGNGLLGSLAVDSGGNMFAIARGSSIPPSPIAFTGVRKFEAGTGTVLETLDAGGKPTTVAIDGSDNLYVGDETSPYRFMVFNSAGEQTSQFGAGQVVGSPGGHSFTNWNGIAVDGNRGFLYSTGGEAVQRFSLPEPGPLPLNERAEDVQPTTATLAATLNPEGDATTFHFEYGTDNTYGKSTPVEALPGTDFADEPVEVEIDQLVPDTTYHFRLVASNHCNPAEPGELCTVSGEDQSFTTAPAAVIDPQWSTHVTSNSATLHAELDPLGVDATWWVEYGTDGSYGSSTPEREIPGSSGALPVHVGLTGLAAGTTYHYRFVARDERDGVVYTVHGVDRTVTTQPSGLDFVLPDRRAWEMVSPPEKFGAVIVNGNYGAIQAAADGSGFAYTTIQSIEREPSASRALDLASVLARRGVSGWSSEDLTPPLTEVTSIRFGGDYKLFSSDLARAVLEARDSTPLSPEASEQTPYLRDNTTDPALFSPLVTSKEPYANVPPGTVFGQEPASIDRPQIEIRAASPDLRHVAFTSKVSLASGAPDEALYLWEGGKLKPVSVYPPSEEGGKITSGVAGSYFFSVRHAVSEDGSEVFWTAQRAGDPRLYVRDMEAEKSARLDLVSDGTGATDAFELEGQPRFQGASADGRFVYFTSSRELTADATPKGRDLYRCAITPGAAGDGCATLTNVSAPLGGSEAKSRVFDIVPALSEDGRRVYFVATGVLDSDPNASGEAAVAGAPNLYFWQEDGTPRFVARLSTEDHRDWGALQFDLAGRASLVTAASSSNGRYFAFMSVRSLTGYDNRDATTGEPLPEVFRYDSVSDRLDCVSCNPSGGRPVGEISSLSGESWPKDPTSTWNGKRVTALLPYPHEAEPTGGPALYEPRRVLDDGRVFFNAVDALVPGDSNGEWDAYQYEPGGIGECSASSASSATARSAGGCVSLLSSGTAEGEAVFLDASESGDDVFFLTPSRLSVYDEDAEVDIYDARVDGITATRAPRTECRGESCQAAISAPDDPTPASSSFHGPGNLKQQTRKGCRKGQHRVKRAGKVRCVKRKSKRRGSGTHQTRRAGR